MFLHQQCLKHNVIRNLDDDYDYEHGDDCDDVDDGADFYNIPWNFL